MFKQSRITGWIKLCLRKLGGKTITVFNTPIYNAVMRYSRSKPTVFHMPGHKLGKGLPAELLENLAMLDVTEIPGLDNLHYPAGIIKEALDLAARAFGADRSFFLVNGSTCGIHAIIMTICKPGDKLIVSRDCHKSVLGGMMLAGVRPVYIKPEFDRTFGISAAITPQALEWALRENPDAVGVFITRPNYYGICSDIKQIAGIVHSFGKVLAVDEAHGAHLAFNRQLPECAMEGGADICVQSAHKTLPAFTQGAYLHVKSNNIDMDRLVFNLRLLQTTSPSYVIMALLDIAREIMEKKGQYLLDRLLDDLERFRNSAASVPGISILTEKTGFPEDESNHPGSEKKNREADYRPKKNYAANYRHDPTRLVVNVRKLGITGFDAEAFLRQEWNIQAEMSDLFNVVFITCISDSSQDLDRLFSAISDLSGRYAGKVQEPDDDPVGNVNGNKDRKIWANAYNHSGNIKPMFDIMAGDLAIPQQKIELKDVMNYPSVKMKLSDAAGKVSRNMVTPYPPGIPVLCPGEIIMDDAVSFIYDIIKSGGNVTGISDDLEIEVVGT